MQIALFKSRSKIGKVIRYYTRSPYSHCAMVFDDGSIIEAREFKGVRRVKSLLEDMDEGQEVDLFDFEATPEQQAIIKDFLEKQIGKDYDYWMVVVGFVLKTTRENRKHSGKWFCSELLFAACEKANFLLLKNIEPWKVAPAMISWSPLLTFNSKVTK